MTFRNVSFGHFTLVIMTSVKYYLDAKSSTNAMSFTPYFPLIYAHFIKN